MKVKDLIAKLQKVDGEKHVAFLASSLMSIDSIEGIDTLHDGAAVKTILDGASVPVDNGIKMFHDKLVLLA